MGATRSTYVAVVEGSSLSELPGEDMPIPDEASPLLHGTRDSQEPQRNTSGRWFSTKLSTSSFLDNNAGLLLVAASQFFFSAMGISVKWLNSLDKPVPTLEVCNTSPDRLYSDMPSVQLVWIRMVCKLCISSNRAILSATSSPRISVRSHTCMPLWNCWGLGVNVTKGIGAESLIHCLAPRVFGRY